MDSLQVLEKINTFYTSSFNQLITLTVAVLAFAGVVMPLLITYYQNRRIKIEKEALESQINSKMIEVKDEIKTNIHAFFEKKAEEYKSEISRLEEKLSISEMRSLGKTLHLEGNSYLSQNNHSLACNSFLSAASSYIVCREEQGLQRVLELVIQSCLPKINSETSRLQSIKTEIDNVIKSIQDLNENRRYSDLITRLEKAFDSASKRTVTTTP